MNWVEVETARCGGSLPRRLVNMQLLSWLSCVQAGETILSELQHFLRKRKTQRQFCEKTVCACAISAIKMAEADAGETQFDLEQAALSRRTPFMTGSWRRKKRQPGAEV